METQPDAGGERKEAVFKHLTGKMTRGWVRNGRRRVQAAAPGALDVPVTETPSQRAAGKELLAEFRERLSEEEGRLAGLRAEGRDWAAVAGEMGGTAEGRRKQLA